MAQRKLTQEEATEIRLRYRGRGDPPYWQLAQEYGVSVQTVNSIVKGMRYTGTRIGRERRAWTERILTLLDRGPLDSEALLAESAPLVPPGRALREADNYRKSMAARRGHRVTEARYTSTERQIRSGQRRIVQHSIADMVKTGRLIREDLDGRIRYRLGRRG